MTNRSISKSLQALLVASILVGSSYADAQVQFYFPNPIRVATFNIHFGVGRDGVYNIARTATAIRDSGADVVALQEVDRYYSPRSNCENQPERILSELGTGWAYVYAPVDDHPGDLFKCGWSNRRQIGDAIFFKNPEAYGYFSIRDLPSPAGVVPGGHQSSR